MLRLAVLIALALPGTAVAGTVLTAKLTGPYLHAPATASGTARITLSGNKVCWKFTFTGIDAPDVAGIHHVPPPAFGVHKTANIPLAYPTTEKPGCGAANPTQVKAVLANPEDYYVIIASKEHPNGVIGGVLHAA